MQQIRRRQHGREDLADDRRDGRAHHAPPAREDEDGVEDDVAHRARQQRQHGIARAAVGADDGVHRLAEHVKRDAERDPEAVFARVGERLGVDRRAERCQDRIHEDEVHRHEHDAYDEREHDGVADAAVRFLRLPRAEADADIGAAAVADHGGDGERDDRQWEHDAVGRVAVGAEIARVGDEELVDDVVQRADEQRQDAWQREFAHQRADRLLGEKGIGLGFVHACLRFSAQRQKNGTRRACACKPRKPTHTTLAYRFVSECCASVYRAFKPDLKFYGSYYTSPRPKKQAPAYPAGTDKARAAHQHRPQKQLHKKRYAASLSKHLQSSLPIYP